MTLKVRTFDLFDGFLIVTHTVFELHYLVKYLDSSGQISLFCQISNNWLSIATFVYI